jgi:cardiolipin synthase
VLCRADPCRAPHADDHHPYFVPGEQVLSALMAAARAVETTLVVPPATTAASWARPAAATIRPARSRGGSEFVPGLLHAKTMVVDESAAIVGSANLDRRSFELNFENTILFEDAALARAISARQRDWLARASRSPRPWPRRLR